MWYAKKLSNIWRNTSLYTLVLLFSHEVLSDSLWPHELQHARLPCPSLSPGVCSNSCPLSPWCHPNISSSDAPFSSCPQSFPVSGSFLWVSSHQVAKVLELQFSSLNTPKSINLSWLNGILLSSWFFSSDYLLVSIQSFKSRTEWSPGQNREE